MYTKTKIIHKAWELFDKIICESMHKKYRSQVFDKIACKKNV